MRRTMLVTVATGLAALFGQAALDGVVAQTRTTLDIYVVDVEGGNAVLSIPEMSHRTLRSGMRSASWPPQRTRTSPK
jgi:hypothetical protein